MCVFCTRAFARFAGRLHGLAPPPLSASDTSGTLPIETSASQPPFPTQMDEAAFVRDPPKRDLS